MLLKTFSCSYFTAERGAEFKHPEYYLVAAFSHYKLECEFKVLLAIFRPLFIFTRLWQSQKRMSILVCLWTKPISMQKSSTVFSKTFKYIFIVYFSVCLSYITQWDNFYRQLQGSNVCFLKGINMLFIYLTGDVKRY